MNSIFSLFSLSIIFLAPFIYSAEQRRIYDNDKPTKNGKHHSYYSYKMNPGVQSLEEVQVALNAINESLEHTDHKKITVDETETEIRLTILQLDPSNLNCGDVVELPLKTISMPKFSNSFDTPTIKTFYKKLFIKRLKEISKKARNIKPYDYFAFEEKMAHDWRHEIKPSIKADLARHCADEISQVITDHYLPSAFTPAPIKALIQEHEQNAKRAETLNTMAQALIPIAEYSNTKTTSNKQKREFKSQYLNALNAVHEELIHE
jgi:hypothetical protein